MEGGETKTIDLKPNEIKNKENMLGNKRERNSKAKDQKEKGLREEIEESKITI